MNISLTFVLLLLGHVLGDFYFQSDVTAKNKCKDFKQMCQHGVIYLLSMGVVLALGAGMPFSSHEWWYILLSVGTVHFIIDICKKYIKGKPFIIDQLLHLFSLVVIWFIFEQNLWIAPLATLAFDYFPGKPAMLIILGFLCILKPIGILISTGEIWSFQNAPKESTEGAGRMIGYLERMIVYFLLITGEFGAIAVVIAAKSVIRFPEINKGTKESKESKESKEIIELKEPSNDNMTSRAEYYLIGTLLSMVSVFVVTFLLGMLPMAH